MTEEKFNRLSGTRVTSPTKKEILDPIINELESYTIGRPRKRDLQRTPKCHFLFE